jgi:hypothetical protein
VNHELAASFDVFRRELRAYANRNPASASEALLVGHALNLLERFLIDVNRIADAAEALARARTDFERM